MITSINIFKQILNESITNKILYHGTNDKNFKRFINNYTIGSGLSKLGIFFTPDKELAEQFSTGKYGEKKVLTSKTNVIVEAKIILNNPYYLNISEMLNVSVSNADIYYSSLRKRLIKDGYDGIIIEKYQDAITKYNNGTTLNSPYYNPQRMLSKYGKNEFEFNQYVVFSPKQIEILNIIHNDDNN